MSQRKRKIEDLERRIKMLEEDERKHDLVIREHGYRLDRHDRIYEQHRAAVQPLLDERQAKTVTITISRDVAKDLAEHDLKDWKVISPELTEACRAGLEGER